MYHKWLGHENIVYAKFLEENMSEFETTKDRRSLNFFTKMSRCLDIGKTNLQCRSHHQKMLKKHKTVEAIIRAFLKIESVEYSESPVC